MRFQLRLAGRHALDRPQSPECERIPAVRYHLVYRSSAGESAKGRPSFYSKLVALTSTLRAAAHLPDGDRIFVNDGAIPEPRASQMAAAGEILTLLGSVGNAGSYCTCVALVHSRGWADEDVVYFAEDDYLHTDDAFLRLVEAVQALPDVAYFTLYDHPDYYRLRLHRRFMARHSTSTKVGPVTWRAVRSTCLTYAARVRALRADSWVHYLCSRGPTPRDFAIWSILEGAGYVVPRLLKPAGDPDVRTLLRRHVGRAVRSGVWSFVDRRAGDDMPRLLDPSSPFADRTRMGRTFARILSRRESQGSALYAAQPGFATHLEDEMLAPGRDWARIAAASKA
jgi:hypothetical protein